jgi:uncharacterized integral membrane protein
MATEPSDPATTTPAPSTPAAESPARHEPAHVVEPTRTSALFKGLLAGSVVLVLLLVFILENTRRVSISYFGANWHMPLGVALLVAAVAGALIVGIVGTARILQLRRRVRRNRHRETGHS